MMKLFLMHIFPSVPISVLVGVCQITLWRFRRKYYASHFGNLNYMNMGKNVYMYVCMCHIHIHNLIYFSLFAAFSNTQPEICCTSCTMKTLHLITYVQALVHTCTCTSSRVRSYVSYLNFKNTQRILLC